MELIPTLCYSFNHKTGCEDVHFTTVCSLTSSDDENDDDIDRDDDHGGNEVVEERLSPIDFITDDESSISDGNGKSSGWRKVVSLI